MAAKYESLRKPGELKGVRTPLDRTMPPHCDRLAKSYEADAKEYEAMAAAHLEAAREIR